MMTLTPIHAQLQVQKIETNNGYTILRETEILIPQTYNYSLHIVDLEPIESVILELKRVVTDIIIKSTEHNIKTSMIKELNNILDKLMTLKEGHHSIHKRGLVNFLGTISKWITGTMDDEDRQLINQQLESINSNNENIIHNLNEQIKINNNFNESINKLHNSILEDRKIIKEFIEKKQDQTSIKLLIFDIKLKIQEIDRLINDLQDNIIFSNLNVIHPSLLSHEEIIEYEIDVNKLKNLKVGFSKTNTNKLIFLIKIPYKMININKKLIIPLSNINDCKAINNEIVRTFEINNIYYEYDINKAFNQLNNLKHCVISKNCKNIENCKTEIYNVNDNNILIQLANNVILTSNCDERKFVLNGNYFINFYNCSINIDNKTFYNNIKEIEDSYIIPNLEYKSINNTLTFDEIILETNKNIDEIKLLKVHKIVTYSSITVIVIIVIITVSIILIIKFLKRDKVNININKEIQENSKVNEGRVIYHNNTDNIEIIDKQIDPHKTVLF